MLTYAWALTTDAIAVANKVKMKIPRGLLINPGY
jgi:hypothetical protein